MKKAITAFALMLCGVAAAGVAQYSPAPGAEFESAEGGALKDVRVFSAVSSGTVKLERVLSVSAYTNAVSISASTATVFTVVWTNAVSHAVTTNVYDSVNVHVPLYCSVLSSNIATRVTATTNTWPVLKEVVTARETICTGSCSGGTFTNSPSGVWLLPGEKMVFSGSASTNGWIRLATE